MIENIRNQLRRSKEIDAEYEMLNAYQLTATEMTEAQIKRVNTLFEQRKQICIWLAMLSEDETYVVRRHLIDGIDFPRIALEYQNRWGLEFAKTERTLKMYQKRALEKIEMLEYAKEQMGITNVH